MPAARLLIVAYHYVRSKADISHPGIHPLPLDEFRLQLDHLHQRLPVISPAEAHAWIGDGRLAEDSALLTFDDGLLDHLHAALELEQRGLRGVFFICSRPALEGMALPVHKIHWLRAHTPPQDFFDQFFTLLPVDWQSVLASPPSDIKEAAAETYQFDAPEHQVLKYLINFTLPYECVDRVTTQMLQTHGLDEKEFCRRTYLSREEIRAMADRGHLIGCHGHLHQPFSRFDDKGLREDVETNKVFLQCVLGNAPSWLAYPFGGEWSLPKDTLRFTTDAGFRAAFTYERGWNHTETRRDRLKRIDCNELQHYLALSDTDVHEDRAPMT